MKSIAPVLLFFSFFYSDRVSAKKPVKIPYSNTAGWSLCQNKEIFDCIVVKKNVTEIEKIKKGKKILVKKAILETWASLFPDNARRELVMKLNRLNIPLREGMFLAVPKDANKTLSDLSPFAKNMAPIGKVLVFDPALLAWAAYDSDGKLVKWGPALGGMDRCPDTWQRCRTVVGDHFKVKFIGDENSRSHLYPIGCGSKKKPCARMPHFVGFHKCYPRKRMCFYGFHASEKMVGKHASHGCVRLFLDDAEWLNQNFSEIDTKVIIKKYPYPNRS